ncbi:MAG: MmgE/PrpD family protein [Promethearchaeota archaeon]
MVGDAGKTHAERIGEFVAGLEFGDIPPRVVRKAKEQVLSVLGAIYAGAGTAPGEIVRKTIVGYGSRPEATIIPTGERVSARDAIAVNSALSIALDYDDYLLAGHTGGSAVPVSLALCEKLGLGGREMLVAQVIANEVEGRLGMAAFLSIQNGQSWSFIHLIGSACAAAKLLRLTAEQTAHAVGIALYQSTMSLWRGFMGPHSKLLTAAIPAKIGLEAAHLAKNGFTGALDIIEAPLGFLKLFADVPIEGLPSDALGKAWVTETLSYKVVPGCAYVDAIADCVEKLYERQPDLKVDDIKEVRVRTNVTSSFMDDLSRPHATLDAVRRYNSHVALNFYLPYVTAVALIDQELTPRQYSPERYLDERVHEFARRVRNIPDNTQNRNALFMLGRVELPPVTELFSGGFSLEGVDLAGFGIYFSGSLEVEMRDGTVHVVHTAIPRGAAGNPYPMSEKFKAESSAYISPASQARALELVGKLETLERVDELVESLTSGDRR